MRAPGSGREREPGPLPEARYGTRESLTLAFVTALQHLPPRERAALLLRDVAGFQEAEVAGILGTSEALVDSALRQARAQLAARLPAGDREPAPAPGSPREREVIARFLAAVRSGDTGRLAALLTSDAVLATAPAGRDFRGRAAVTGFWAGLDWWGVQAPEALPTRANGQPAFGLYISERDDSERGDSERGGAVARARGLVVLALEGDRICAITCFGPDGVFPLFGLPGWLPARPRLWLGRWPRN